MRKWLPLFLACFVSVNTNAGPLADRAIGNFAELPEGILASLQVQRRVAGMPISLHLVDLHLDGSVTDWNYVEPARLDGINIDYVLAKQIRTIGKVSRDELASAKEILTGLQPAAITEERGKGSPELREHTVIYMVKRHGLTFHVAEFFASSWKTIPGNPAAGLMKLLNERFAGPYSP